MKRCVALILLLATTFVLLCSCGGTLAPIRHGRRSGNVYANESLGIKFTKPSRWNYASDAEIEEQMGVPITKLEADELYSETGVVDMVEFCTYNSTTGDNIMLIVERLPFFQGNMTEQNYLDIRTEETEPDVTTENGAYEPFTLCGIEFTRTTSRISSQDMPTLYQFLYVKNIGGYILSIVITATNNDPSSYEAMFTAYGA